MRNGIAQEAMGSTMLWDVSRKHEREDGLKTDLLSFKKGSKRNSWILGQETIQSL